MAGKASQCLQPYQLAPLSALRLVSCCRGEKRTISVMAFPIQSNFLLGSVSGGFSGGITSLICAGIKSTLLVLEGWLKLLTKQNLADLKGERPISEIFSLTTSLLCSNSSKLQGGFFRSF